MNRRDFLASTAAVPLMGQTPESAHRKSRMKPALCAYSFRTQLQNKSMTYEDLVGKCVDWDVDGLDTTVYWFPNTTPEWLLNLRRVAYRQGIELYSIAVRTELTKASQEDRDKEVASMEKWVEVASLLGAGHIRVFGGNVPKGVDEAAAVPWVVECLKRAADVAGKKGIILGLENHGGICTRAERILEMVTKVNSPWVGINLDTGNFVKDAFAQMKMCLPYAVNVQVKAEMKFDDGTTGPQDWNKVVGLLAEGGYRGYLSLEYEAKEPAETAVPRGLKQLGELTRKYSGRG